MIFPPSHPSSRTFSMVVEMSAVKAMRTRTRHAPPAAGGQAGPREGATGPNLGSAKHIARGEFFMKVP